MEVINLIMFGLISEFFRSRITLNYFLVSLSRPIQTNCWDSRNDLIQVISDTKYKEYKELTGLMSKEELRNPQRITTHRIKEFSLKCNVPEEEINSLFKLFEINYRIPLPKDPIERIEFVYNYKW
ncbi:hypothetical protein OM416_20045 [Paenibacillus sp. LS1]|nr:hypothetical protein [Paenibacillus sp. LS1]